jgi:hypothetical protein
MLIKKKGPENPDPFLDRCVNETYFIKISFFTLTKSPA